jgi:hypothetical protein
MSMPQCTLFFKTCKTRFSLREERTKSKFGLKRYKGKPHKQKKHITTKLETEITAASKAARQEFGQAEGRLHAPRSWRHPRLS